MQHIFGEYLGGGFKAKAFSRRVIDAVLDGFQSLIGEIFEVDIERQIAPKPAVHVFNSAFLPRAMTVAKVRLKAEAGVEPIVISELDAVILGEGFAQGWWYGFKPKAEVF